MQLPDDNWLGNFVAMGALFAVTAFLAFGVLILLPLALSGPLIAGGAGLYVLLSKPRR